VAAFSIRGIDDQVRDRLRIRAARHGHSMEAEIRSILENAVRKPDTSEGLFGTLLNRFGDLGGADLDLPPRTTSARAAEIRR
jgi:plasmid stability protein